LGPAHDPAGTTSAVDGLFKTIEILPSTSSINVVNDLHAETDRMADILRYELIVGFRFVNLSQNLKRYDLIHSFRFIDSM
jgi:hypothetical protein